MKDNVVLWARGLTKSYGKIQALRGIDLEVRRGEMFGFLGPNGAGKTTAIRCMLDLIRPQGGTLRVLGFDPQADPVAVRAHVGYLPGELHMEESYKVKDQLRYYKDLRSNHIDWDFVQQLARRLDLDLAMPIKNLSKGNKQKVGIVQALMSRPELLLMDEPTSGLDPLMQHEVYRMLREAQAEGATVFFSSHIISEVEILAERVAIIRQGIIVEEADPRRLMEMSLRRIRVRFSEAIDPTPLAEIEGVTLLSSNKGTSAHLQVEGDMDGLIKALGAFQVRDIKIERPSLEDIFLTYYKDEDKEEETN